MDDADDCDDADDNDVYNDADDYVNYDDADETMTMTLTTTLTLILEAMLTFKNDDGDEEDAIMDYSVIASLWLTNEWFCSILWLAFQIISHYAFKIWAEMIVLDRNISYQ